MRNITFLLLIAFSLVSTVFSVAQTAADYVFTSSSGTYTQITGGTISTATGDDGTQAAVPIGFTFNYCGTNYTTFNVSTNGLMGLGYTPSYTNDLASATTKPIIAALWDDLYDDAGSDVLYLTSGTAPNRVLTVEWRNIRWVLSGGSTQNFQIKLFETTNVIQFEYGAMSAPIGSPSASIGFNDNTGGSGHFLSVTPAASPTFSTTLANNTIAAATFLTNGLTYTFTPSSCQTPTVLSVSGITQTSANLSWTSTGTLFNIQYGNSGFVLGTGTIVSGVTASPYSLTGLNPSTDYSFYVQNDCGGGSTSNWTGPFTFTTACGAMTAPYSQNFDGVTVPNLPSCWNKVVVFTTGTPNVQTTTTTPNSVPNCAQLYNSTASGSGTHLLLVSPQFSDLPSHTTQIRFWAKFTGSGTGLVHVGTMTDPANPATFSVFQSIMTLTNTWQEFVIPFSTYVGSNEYIAFKHGLGLTNQYIYIDNVVYETIPTCPQPSVLSASSITDISASLNWTANGTETLWNIQYGPAGFTLGTGTIVNGVAAHPYTLTGLTPSTNYSYYVQADCGGGDISAWSGPYSFTTLCTIVSVIPWNYGFETGCVDASTNINCFTQEVTGTYYWTGNSTQTTYNRVPRTGTWNAFLHYSGDAWLFREVNLTGGTSYDFKIWARQDMADTSYASLQIKYGNTATSAGMTNVIVAHKALTNGNYQLVKGTFTPATTGNYYIGIHGIIAGTPWYLSIDDMTLELTPSCLEPSSLTVSNVTATTADLSWTAGGTETSWDIQYGPLGFALGTGTILNNVTSNPYSLTGISSSTTYQYYVLAQCSPTDSSTWAGPYAFSTSQIPATLPYINDFESGLNGAIIVNGAQVNKWAEGTATAHGGTHSLYISADNGATNNYNIATTSVVHLYRDITFTPGTLPYKIDFWWKGVAESCCDYLKVYMVPTTTDPMEGVQLTATQLGTTYNSQSSWQLVSLTLPDTLAGKTKRIVFSWRNDGSIGTPPPMAIDDINIYQLTCPQPTALNASNILDVSADLGWTPGSTETMWDIQYGLSGFALGTGTIVNDLTANTYSLTGLTPVTAYQFYVLAQCSSSDSSVWAGPYTFTTQMTICSGIPVAGTVTSSANPVCPGVNFNLYVTGYTVAGGVNFQWQSSTDGITFTNITGATNDTISVSQPVTSYYQCIVTCIGSGLSDTTAVFTENINPFINCYCTSNATTTADEEIFNVTVGTLNNTSTCTTVAGPGSILNEYSNFTALTPPDLSRTISVPFSVQVNTCGVTNYNSGVAIFIDFNQNGLFTDPGEKVYSNGALANVTCVPSTILSGTFTVPLSAALGNTRMRVIDAEGYAGDNITPCLTYGYGETEDYTVNITAAPSCIQPDSLNATNILDVSADLSWHTYSSETAWDIQYGISGFTLGTGTIIENVGSNPYTLTGLTSFTTYQYYVLAQCSPTDSSAWSGPYTFTTLLTQCSGTPVAGTVASSLNPVCSGVNFSLTLAGSSVASGLTYQWQSSPDGVTFTDITGATNDTLTTSQTDTTYFQCVVTCTVSGLNAVTPAFQETMSPLYGCYCASNATSTGDEEIFNVTVATLNNSSTCSTTGGPGSILNQYSNYTAITPPMLGQSTTVSFSVQVGTCGGNYNNGVAIWIDFNQNGSFADPGEKVYNSTTTTSGPHIESGNISIPITASLGITGMRVISQESVVPSNPCGTYTWGETEDYLVNIVPAPTCIQPNTLTATNITSTSADLGWTAVNGETSWDIQYGPSGFILGTGTLLENINTNPYSLTGLSTATTYQFYVLGQCSPTDSSFWSGPFTFTTLCGVINPDYYEPINTYLPNCWSEAQGQLAAPVTFTSTTTSYWNQDGFGNVGTTGAAGVNIYSTLHYEWLISPEIDLGSSGTDYQLEFDLALTAYASTGAPGTTGTDDKFVVVISTDAGVTWSSVNALRTWNNSGSPYVYNSIPPTGTHVTIPLTGYTGVVKFGFYGESTISNADNDLFIDNVRIRKPVDLSIVSPADGTHNQCGLTANENVTICVKNVGATTINSGAVIYTWYKVNANPAVADTLTLSANLLPADSVFFTFSQTADFSAVSSYLVNYWIHYSEDISTANDTSYTTLVNYIIYVNILGGDTVLVDPIYMPYTLTIQASPFTYDSHAWSNSDGSLTGTSSTFDAPAFGWYYLTVTDGACSATDSVFVGDITNVSQASLSNTVSVFPNPTDGRFNILVHAASKSDYKLELYSSEGRKVFEKLYNNVSDISQEIDGSRFAEGLYTLKIRGNNKLEVFKVAIH